MYVKPYRIIVDFQRNKVSENLPFKMIKNDHFQMYQKWLLLYV